MKRFKLISLGVLCLPALALAKASPDEVFTLFNQRLNTLGSSLSNPPFTNSETLVNGIYVFWSTKSNSAILTNESASIVSQDGGIKWAYMTPGLPAVTDMEVLRSALLSNVKFDELLVQRYGKGQRKLVYFTAFDCPYCNNFEKKLKPLTDLGNATVYAVPGNLDEKDPIRSKVVRALWCANSSWTEWVEFAQTRKPKLDVVKADNSHCSAVRTSAQALMLQRMLRGGRTGVPFLMADDGWAGTPSAQASISELKAIFAPPKGGAAPLKLGQGHIDLAHWGAERVVPLPEAAALGGTYQIGEGLSGTDNTVKSIDPEALKKLKLKLKEMF